jgi:hypothetical protein
MHTHTHTHNVTHTLLKYEHTNKHTQTVSITLTHNTSRQYTLRRTLGLTLIRIMMIIQMFVGPEQCLRSK